MTSIKTNWDPRLKEGEEAEKELLAHIQRLYPTAKKIEGNFKDYDIYISDINTIEVKYDVKAQQTGNFAFEIRSHGIPSGLSTTKARWFVTVDTMKFYFFETVRLKDYIRTNWKYMKKVMGGDDKSSQLVIIDRPSMANQSFSAPFFRNDFNYSVFESLMKT